MPRKSKKSSILNHPMSWRTIFDLANVIMVFLDENQKVSMINCKGCEVLGYTEKYIIGKNWFDHFIPFPEREKVKKVYNAIIQGDIQANEYYTNHVLTKKGEKLKISWSNTYLRDSKGCIRFTLSAGQVIK